MMQIQSMMQTNRHLMSLTDGYAFDLDHGTYCKLANHRLLERQVFRLDHPISILMYKL
jgi:hypothetical protein